MENFRKSISFEFQNKLSKQDMSLIRTELANTDGIIYFKVGAGSVLIDYITLKLTEDAVREILKRNGLPIKSEKRKRPGILRTFIENLAANNKKAFGNQKLDCCGMNKNPIKNI